MTHELNCSCTQLLTARKPFSLSIFTANADKQAKQILVWSSSVSPETCVSALIWDSKVDLFIPLKGYCMFSLLLSVAFRITCNSNENRVEQSCSTVHRADEIFWAPVTKACIPTEESCHKCAKSLNLCNLSFHRSKSEVFVSASLCTCIYLTGQVL